MMANDGHIAEDTLFGPERLAARAIDWDQSDRGLSSGRAAIMLQIRRRIHGRSRNHASITRKTLALREPSIHGPSECPIEINRVFTRTSGVHALIFAKLKALLRKAAARTYDELWKAVGVVCDLFTEEECHNYFVAAGYKPE